MREVDGDDIIRQVRKEGRIKNKRLKFLWRIFSEDDSCIVRNTGLEQSHQLIHFIEGLRCGISYPRNKRS